MFMCIFEAISQLHYIEDLSKNKSFKFTKKNYLVWF